MFSKDHSYSTFIFLVGADSSLCIFSNYLNFNIIQPKIKTLFGAYVWLGETITFMKIMGAFVVISGVILTTQSKRRTRRKVEESIQKEASF